MQTTGRSYWSRYGVMTAFAVLAICGLLAGVAIVKDFARARASFDWPTVDGVILSGVSGETRYAYFRHGRNYESTSTRFLCASLRPRRTDYVAGQLVTVYVAPDNPGYSVLSPGGSGRLFAAALGVCGVMVFVGLGGLVRNATSAASRPATPAEPDPSRRALAE